MLQCGLVSVVVGIRLADGTDTCGRLEVYAFDDWRVVCPEEFHDIDASIACIELGFGYVYVREKMTMMSR